MWWDLVNSKKNEPSEKLLDINNNKENSRDITKINLYKIIDLNNINFNNVYRTIKMMSVFFLFITQNDVLFDLCLLKYKIAKNVIELCRRFICVWVILGIM